MPAFFGFEKAAIVFHNGDKEELSSLVPSDTGPGYSETSCKFPNCLGITGRVAQKGGLCSYENVTKIRDFASDIDNTACLPELRNALFGALPGVAGKSVAVLQMSNKQSTTGEISLEDEVKLKNVSPILGVCIDSTLEVMDAMTLVINLRSSMGGVTQNMSGMQITTGLDSDSYKIQNFLGNIKTALQSIMKTNEKQSKLQRLNTQMAAQGLIS